MNALADQAVNTKNYSLATEIFENRLKEYGPSTNIYLDIGRTLALSGKLTEAFTAYLKAYRLGTVKSEEISPLVAALVKVTKERMQAANGTSQNKNRLILDAQTILESEPFFCGLCLGTVSEPSTIFCGHTFCSKCLLKRTSDSCIICGPNPRQIQDQKQNVMINAVVEKLFPNAQKVATLKRYANKLVQEGNLKAALEEYKSLSTICEEDHTIWSNRSYVNYSLGNYQTALEEASKAVEVRPQWPKGYYRMGKAQEALGKTQEAAMNYMKCLALDDTMDEADKNLTQILDRILKPEAAPNIDVKQRVVEMRRQPVSALLSGSEDSSIQEGLEQLREILDKQFQQCDKELQFASRMENINTSIVTIDEMECSLCCRLLYEPVTTPCGHSFCRYCLSRALDHSINCPQCRTPLAEYMALHKKPITIALDIIIKKWWPDEMEERRKAHLEELVSFSTIGQTAVIPVFVCSLAFPTISCPLHVFEPRYRLMIRQVMESGVRQFGMCLPGDNEAFVEYGTMLEICDVQFFSDGRSVVDTVGGRRFRVLERHMREGYHTATVEFLDETPIQQEELSEVERVNNELYEQVQRWLSSLPPNVLLKIIQNHGSLPHKERVTLVSRLGPSWLWWLISVLPINPSTQLTLLATNSLKDRLNTAERMMAFMVNRQ